MDKHDGEKFESVQQLVKWMISHRLEYTGFQADAEIDQQTMDILKAELMRELPQLLELNVGRGLLGWAVKTMGDNLPKYCWQAFDDYFVLLEMHRARTGSSIREAIKATPFSFPMRIRSNHQAQFSRLDENFRPIHGRVKEIKSACRGDAIALHHELGEYACELFGRNIGARAVDSYISMQPAQIALEFTCLKYHLPMGSEALKKIIAKQSDSAKLARSFVKDYLRELQRGAAPSG